MPKNGEGGGWGQTGYDPSPLTMDKMVGAAEVGYMGEALEMANRLIASGLDQRLALIAVDQMMGMNSKTQAPTIKPPQTEQEAWDEYEKKHPYMAAAKKQLVVGTRPLQDLGKAIIKGSGPDDIKAQREKARAAQMLKEYIQSQEARMMNEENQRGLWMLARMPGAPLAGQPIYGGPTPEMPLPPLTNQDLTVGPARIQQPLTPQNLSVGPVRINGERMTDQDRRAHLGTMGPRRR